MSERGSCVELFSVASHLGNPFEFFFSVWFGLLLLLSIFGLVSVPKRLCQKRCSSQSAHGLNS